MRNEMCVYLCIAMLRICNIYCIVDICSYVLCFFLYEYLLVLYYICILVRILNLRYTKYIYIYIYACILKEILSLIHCRPNCMRYEYSLLFYRLVCMTTSTRQYWWILYPDVNPVNPCQSFRQTSTNNHRYADICALEITWGCLESLCLLFDNPSFNMFAEDTLSFFPNVSSPFQHHSIPIVNTPRIS